MSQKCHRCQGTNSSPQAFILTCADCGKSWHHRCHIPPVEEVELIALVKATNRNDVDHGLSSWVCRCRRKAKNKAKEAAKPQEHLGGVTRPPHTHHSPPARTSIAQSHPQAPLSSANEFASNAHTVRDSVSNALPMPRTVSSNDIAPPTSTQNQSRFGRPPERISTSFSSQAQTDQSEPGLSTADTHVTAPAKEDEHRRIAKKVSKRKVLARDSEPPATTHSPSLPHASGSNMNQARHPSTNVSPASGSQLTHASHLSSHTVTISPTTEVAASIRQPSPLLHARPASTRPAADEDVDMEDMYLDGPHQIVGDMPAVQNSVAVPPQAGPRLHKLAPYLMGDRTGDDSLATQRRPNVRRKARARKLGEVGSVRSVFNFSIGDWIRTKG
ncbi:hypothetical protein PLICRDRAFT_273106 [Plicaturopsis crispa FD-325 SS-3]|nr:hypothetical protein PLICRDRAFT_273106 [Plicaturopsis crispa FD-325 SS-3]